MLKEIIETKVISEDEKRQLEEAWYGYKAMEELLKSGMTSPVVFERFEKAFGRYNKTWSMILGKYFDKDYTKGSYNWECDFPSNTVTIFI